MTAKELAELALASIEEEWAALAKTTKGLKGSVGSPGPNWSAAMRASRSAQSALRSIVEQSEEEPAPEPEPEPEPEPPGRYAPRTYNRSASGDARFCVEGLPKDSTGAHVDAMGIRYDDGGRDLGGRDGSRVVPGIKSSDMMDDKGPCDPYEWQGRSFPPWPPESYLR